MLIIPAFGGYLFLTNTYATSFAAYRESGYHLIFKSVIAGLILFAVSYLIAGAIYPYFSYISDFYPNDSRIWGRFSPTDSGAFVLSLLLGKFSPYCFNRLYSSERAIEKVLQKESNQTELILKEAVDTGKLVELSLKNGKSYVGTVVAFDVLPRDNKRDVAIFPVLIGYWDKDTFRLQFTTNYITKDCIDKDLGEMVMPRVAMPMSEIVAVSLFDSEMYKRLHPALPRKAGVSANPAGE